MKIFPISLYFVVISFLACGKSKVVASEFAEAIEASNAYAQAIEENYTDCDKMANALKKPLQNWVKIGIELKKTGIELKHKKTKFTKEAISASNRVTAASKLLIQCASHPRIRRLFQSVGTQFKNTD